MMEYVMNLTNAQEKRLELAVMDRLRHVMEPAVREAMQEVLHGGRRTQNNIQEPGPGKCRDVWDMLDGMENPSGVTLAAAVEMGVDRGFNPNNTRVEFYRWRAFNGYNLQH